MTLLQTNRLTSGYGKIPVLFDVDLTVSPGEIVAVIGANGAGKSTLLRTIAGSIRSHSGKVRFKGSDITNRHSHEVNKMGIALVPEGRQIFSDLSVKDNLILPAMNRHTKLSTEQIQSELEEIVHLFPVLKERYSQKAGTLSGGEQQMLAIGRALMSKPELLMLDEPSLGLAPIVTKNIFSVIKDLSKKMSVLLVEQNALQALRLSNRSYILRNGHVVKYGISEDLISNEELIHSYLA